MRWILLGLLLCIPSSVESLADDRAAELRGGIDDDGGLRPALDGLSAFLGRPRVQPKPLVWETDYPAALARAKAEKRPMLVMFRADWCRPCRTMEQTTLSDPWIQTFLSDFVLVRSNEDAARMKEFRVSALPTICVLYDGRLMTQSKGSMDAGRLAAKLAEVFAGMDRKLPPGLRKLLDEKHLPR